MIAERRKYLWYDTKNDSYELQSLFLSTGLHLTQGLEARLDERQELASCLVSFAIVPSDLSFTKRIIHLSDPPTVGKLHAQRTSALLSTSTSMERGISMFTSPG